MTPTTFTFAVYPSTLDPDDFEPFLVEVPSTLGLEPAARRAYWTVFATIGREPGDFLVACWNPRTGNPGPAVESGGIVGGASTASAWLERLGMVPA